MSAEFNVGAMNDVIQYFVASWLVAVAAGVAFCEFRRDLRNFNKRALTLAYVGTIPLSIGFWAWSRHNSDHGWWPLIVSIYSAAWVMFVLSLAACIRRFVPRAAQLVPADQSLPVSSASE